MGRFRDALAVPGLSAIAEVKRRSPSAGDLRPDADPARLSAQFAKAGASAISILVDERFGGSIDDLRAARAATVLPLLAKGFFREELQLLQLKVAGADAVLLLLRDLDDATARALLGYARELGMDALVEAHDANELQRAVGLEAPIVGVNARDLQTFEIDRRTQLQLVARMRRHDAIVVAESGVGSRAQGAAAEVAGADAILVGSSLMRAPAVLDVPEDRLSVAVFVGDAEETDADLVQLYAHEEGRVRGREAWLLREGEQVARVVDLPWQEDDPLHFQRAAATEGRVMLAGRLGPENVREAVRAVHPWAVDAASRLEAEPGIKDHEKVRSFVDAAR